MEIVVKRPSDCSAADLQNFVELVREGDEVSTVGLEQRVEKAERLVFLMKGGELVGVGAAKRPEADYRKTVFAKSGVELGNLDLPYEVGWFFVKPGARGGAGKLLLSAALAETGSAGVFATSRTENDPMHHCLIHQGFAVAGKPFPSNRGKHMLQLFIRSPKA